MTESNPAKDPIKPPVDRRLWEDAYHAWSEVRQALMEYGIFLGDQDGSPVDPTGMDGRTEFEANWLEHQAAEYGLEEAQSTEGLNADEIDAATNFASFLTAMLDMEEAWMAEGNCSHIPTSQLQTSKWVSFRQADYKHQEAICDGCPVRRKCRHYCEVEGITPYSPD